MLGSLFNKVADLKPATLLKRDFNTGVFLYCAIFKNSFFIEHLRLLLPMQTNIQSHVSMSVEQPQGVV